MRFDLHVHTALSACAEDVMSPGQVVRRAAAAGLTILAVTDHNASAHVRPAMRAAAGSGLTVVPGMEVCSREEVHLLALFADAAALADLQELVDAALPAAENVPAVFGYQVVYDDHDEICDLDRRLRQAGTALSIERLVAEIHQRGGLAVPAHVFRGRFSLLSQLGAVDAGPGFDLLEIGYSQWVRDKYRLGRRYAGVPLITGSDAHFLEDIGRVAKINVLPAAADDLRALAPALRALPEEDGL